MLMKTIPQRIIIPRHPQRTGSRGDDSATRLSNYRKYASFLLTYEWSYSKFLNTNIKRTLTQTTWPLNLMFYLSVGYCLPEKYFLSLLQS